MTKEEQDKFRYELTLPIFAHRREKKLDCLSHIDEEDFKIVVEACDGFSGPKLRAYLIKPTLSFLFLWFTFACEEGRSFAKREIKSKHRTIDNYTEVMLSGINEISQKALQALLESDEQLYSKKLMKYAKMMKWNMSAIE